MTSPKYSNMAVTSQSYYKHPSKIAPQSSPELLIQSRNNVASAQSYLTLPSGVTGVKMKNKQSAPNLLPPHRGANLQAYKEPVDEVSEVGKSGNPSMVENSGLLNNSDIFQNGPSKNRE